MDAGGTQLAHRNGSQASRARVTLAALLLVVGVVAAMPPQPAMDGLPPVYDDETLVARPTTLVPVVDGVAEPLWNTADSLEIVATGASGNFLPGSGIQVKAFHNYSWMYFLVTWPDSSPDRLLDAWQLTDNSTPEGNWTRTGWGEDAFSFFFDDGLGPEQNFSSSGCAALCHAGPDQMHTTSPGFLDLWHWSAARTDPLGFADDRYLDNGTKQGGSSTGGLHPDTADPFSNNTVVTAYGDRPWVINASAPLTSEHIADGDKQAIDWITPNSGAFPNGTVIPAWVLSPPAFGEGDVRALATHNGTGWTLEVARPLATGDVTGHDVDVADLGVVYYFSVSVTDNKTLLNHSTPLLANKLVFAENLDPDYVVRSAVPQVAAVEAGQVADITTLVRNNGFSDGVPSIAVSVVHAGNQTEISRVTTAGIAWGKERSLTLAVDTTGLAPANYTLMVLADADNATSESNESNNGRTFNLTVLAPTLYPDVIISNLTGPPGPAFAPDNLTLTGWVANQGNAATGANVVLRATNGSLPDAEVDLGALGVGEGVSFELNLSTAGAGTGPYFITVTADPDNAVDEGPGGEGNNTATVVASVEARPNLDPVQLTLFPAAVLSGDPTDLSITITNDAAAHSGIVTLWAYLDNQTSVGTDGRVLTWTVDLSVARGEFVTIQKSWQTPGGLTPGGHSVRVWLDATGLVPETDETDNNVSAGLLVLEPPRPDLTVTSASLDRAQYAAGELAVLTASVTNAGANYTAGVVLELRDAISNATLANTTFPPVAAGATAEVSASFTVPAGPAGSRLVTVVVDPDDELAEASEFNNSATASYTLLEPPAVDLRVGALTATPATPVTGETVRLAVEVFNDGNVASEATDGTFRLGATAIGTVVVPALAAGSGVTLSLDWQTAGFTGLQALVTFVADPGGTVLESNESNNAASLTIPFTRPGAPAMRLGPLSLAPAEVTPGEVVRLEVTVSNNGTAPGSGTVRFSVGGVAVGEVSVDLDAGANQTVVANWTANASGTRFAQAELVVGGDVADSKVGTVSVLYPAAEPPADSTWVVVLVAAAAAAVAVGFLYLRARRPPASGAKAPRPEPAAEGGVE